MKTKLLIGLAVSISGFNSSCDAQQQSAKSKTSTAEVVLASEIKWQPLNPKRGNKGPQAGTLWGDQTKDGQSGFLVKFVDGFSSPPHIHNITYRGVVIFGALHNDDPEAEPMWMKSGSYWTQPAGEVHITAARGAGMAFLEIQQGPYLVMPPEEAFDRGERPVNVDASNIVWLNAATTNWIEPATGGAKASSGPELAFLWGKTQGDQVHGSLVKLPAGLSGTFHSESSEFRAVVIEGQPKLRLAGESDIRDLSPAAYFGSTGKAIHQVTCDDEYGCLIYVRTKGQYTIR